MFEVFLAEEQGGREGESGSGKGGGEEEGEEGGEGEIGRAAGRERVEM